MRASRTTLGRRERALLVPALRGVGAALLLAGPVVAAIRASQDGWAALLWGAALASGGLLCLVLGALAGAIFEIADRARALSGDPRLQ